jgi:hypothetical protein
MTTEEQARRYDLCYALYHARKQLASVPADDVNGREDVLHRVRSLESQLGLMDEREFAAFCLNVEAAEAELRRLNRERAYEKRGNL